MARTNNNNIYGLIPGNFNLDVHEEKIYTRFQSTMDAAKYTLKIFLSKRVYDLQFMKDLHSLFAFKIYRCFYYWIMRACMLELQSYLTMSPRKGTRGKHRRLIRNLSNCLYSFISVPATVFVDV